MSVLTQSEMTIPINSEVSLTELRQEDKYARIAYLNEPEIYKNTLLIPFPYTPEDADAWYAYTQALDVKTGRQNWWAIRNDNDELIGEIGLNARFGSEAHKDELSCWLAVPHWNKGLMTDVVRRFAEHCLFKYNLIRLEAHIFVTDQPSQNVLKKAGFHREALLKDYFLKDGERIDGLLYSRVR